MSCVSKNIFHLIFGLFLLVSMFPSSGHAGALNMIKANNLLRVCHWPGYYSISFLNNKNGKLEGLDIDLARELAKDLNVKLKFMSTSFSTFIKDVKADKCDVAMFGVGITKSRAQSLDFSIPYLRSDIYAIVPKTHATIKKWEDMDDGGHILVTLKGTFMEEAAKGFTKASILSVVKFQQREKEVRTGRADAFLTDYPYGKKILKTYDWAKLLAPPKPFYMTEYAYAVNKGDKAWLSYINGFVERIKTDGRLKKYAKENGLLPIAIF